MALTQRAVYGMEYKADNEIARIQVDLDILRAKQSKWRELSTAARAYQDWLSDPECFDGEVVETDLRIALFELGLAQTSTPWLTDGELATASEASVPPIGVGI